jgi:U3 small nucleolar RNA-associated protein 21
MGALFEPYRCLGCITDDVPFAVQRRGKETYVTVSVGRTWQTFNTSKLLLVLVGPQVSPGVAGSPPASGRMGFNPLPAANTRAPRRRPTPPPPG